MHLLHIDRDQHQIGLRLSGLGDTKQMAESLAACMQTPIAIALMGTLGAGKTQWTRFFAQSLGAPPQTISSPTFVIMQRYDSMPVIYHLDAYRLGDEDELYELGIEELWETDAITIMEWADRFPTVLPTNRIELRIELEDVQTSPQQKQTSGHDNTNAYLRDTSDLKHLTAPELSSPPNTEHAVNAFQETRIINLRGFGTIGESIVKQFINRNRFDETKS